LFYTICLKHIMFLNAPSQFLSIK